MATPDFQSPSRRRSLQITVGTLALAVSMLACNLPAQDEPLAPSGTPAPTPFPSPTILLTPEPARPPVDTPSPSPEPTSTPDQSPAIPADAITKGPFVSVASVDGVLPGNLQWLHASPDGLLWLVTDGGVARLDGTAWTVVLSDNTGILAGIDDAGRIWVVSEDTSEIASWDGAWTIYGADEGWSPVGGEWRTVGWAVMHRGRGQLWLATARDVRVFDGERWAAFTLEDMGMEPGSDNDLQGIFQIVVSDHTGDVWVGECDWGGPGPFGGRGARWYDGQGWEGSASPVASGCVTAIQEDRDGRVWLSVDGDLWQSDADSVNWSHFAPPDPPDGAVRYGFVDHLVLDSAGDPWPILVACGGASCSGPVVQYRLQDGNWVQIAVEPWLEWVQGLVFDESGASWLFWEGAVHRVVGDALEHVVDFRPQLLTVDHTGRVWVVAADNDRDLLWTLDVTTGD